MSLRYPLTRPISTSTLLSREGGLETLKARNIHHATTASSSSSSGSASDTDSFGEYIRNDDHVNENAGNNAGNVNDNGRNN